MPHRKPRTPQKVKSRQLARPSLTVREKQIVDCVCEAKLNKIAHQLHLAEGTVKVFMSTIFSQTGVSKRNALALWTLRQSVESEPS
jgi:DNA-binding NarL/FixJ family response regulator